MDPTPVRVAFRSLLVALADIMVTPFWEVPLSDIFLYRSR